MVYGSSSQCPGADGHCYRRLGPDGVPAADWRLKTMQCSVSSPTSLLRPETGLQSPDRPWPARPPPRAGASPAGEAALISEKAPTNRTR